MINGPNLNLLGKREVDIYGTDSYDECMQAIKNHALKNEVDIQILQSNHEGQLVDWIQEAYFEKVDGIIINPAAYTHTSVAIRDAIAAIVPIPVIEVHLSDINQREEFRKVSFCRDVCVEQISGKGIFGYLEAIDMLVDKAEK